MRTKNDRPDHEIHDEQIRVCEKCSIVCCMLTLLLIGGAIAFYVY